jgi:hypothetical protein
LEERGVDREAEVDKERDGLIGVDREGEDLLGVERVGIGLLGVCRERSLSLLDW